MSAHADVPDGVARPGRIDRVLISATALEERVHGLAHEIARTYAVTSDGLIIVTVLSGSLVFLADLIRKLPLMLRIGLVTVSSYPGGTTRSAGAKLLTSSYPELQNRDVLLVDDILDTGGTLRLVQREIRAAVPRSLRTAVLLRKTGKAPPDVTVDFVGFDIEDVFVVGYGLDYDGLYRNLPHIAEWRPGNP